MEEIVILHTSYATFSCISELGSVVFILGSLDVLPQLLGGRINSVLCAVTFRYLRTTLIPAVLKYAPYAISPFPFDY